LRALSPTHFICKSVSDPNAAKPHKQAEIKVAGIAVNKLFLNPENMQAKFINIL
jgi:hypothetical protein